MTFGLVDKQADKEDLDIPEVAPVKPEDFQRAIYVAGASSELTRAAGVMAQLRAAGMVVTSTWVDVITDVGDANPMGASRDQRAVWSAVDLHQVSQAAYLLYLLPSPGVSTSGAWVEMGYALALKAIVEQMAETGAPVPANAHRTILVAGQERSIFSALADHFVTDQAAVDHVLKETSALRTASVKSR